MKRRIISTVVLSTLATSAFAQSTMTLYGVMDEGIDFTSNVGGKHAYEMTSGYAQGSRWGMRGTEDLGGGYRAVFVIESGFNLSNGRLAQGGLGYGRQVYVGLGSDRFGTLTLGRQYDAVVDYFAPTTAVWWGGYIFAHPFDNDNASNTFRVNNTVKYQSPELAGLQFGGAYSFSNSTGFANNRQASIGARYTYGGLLLAAAFLNADNPGATSGGAIAGSSSTVYADANFQSERLRIFGAGMNYTFGQATLGLAYSNTTVKNPVANVGYLYGTETIQPVVGRLTGGTVTALKYQNFEVSGRYQINPAFYVGAQYAYTLENYDTTAGGATPKVHSFGLMADYSLSKRTDLYLQGVYQKVAGDRTGSSLDQAYVAGAQDVSSTSKQLLVRAAIRHLF